MLKQRNGQRHNIKSLLDIVVYSTLGMPDFCNEFEINCGGMRFNASIDYQRGEQVVVRLFMQGKDVLELYGVFLRREDDGTSVVKFETLGAKEWLVLSRILYQTPDLSR